MIFDIGGQYAAIVNNVAGDQTVQGGQHGYVMVPPEVIAAVRAIRTHLGDLSIDANGETVPTTSLRLNGPARLSPQIVRRFRRWLPLAPDS